MTQDFKKPIELVFTSLIKDGKFYTLDGSKEVTMRTYSRYITSMEELTRKELRWLVYRYFVITDQIRDIRSEINKMEV